MPERSGEGEFDGIVVSGSNSPGRSKVWAFIVLFPDSQTLRLDRFPKNRVNPDLVPNFGRGRSWPGLPIVSLMQQEMTR
jgi:hypothetical protein